MALDQEDVSGQPEAAAGARDSRPGSQESEGRMTGKASQKRPAGGTIVPNSLYLEHYP